MDWRLDITLLPERFAVCRMDPGTPPPAWATRAAFSALVRTPEELCIVCPERDAPSRVKKVVGWRALRLAGTIDHTGESGVLLTVVEPLARAGVPVFPVTSFYSGYVLVHEPHVEQALTTLRAWGHAIHEAARS
jgi:uncharacterized protein